MAIEEGEDIRIQNEPYKGSVVFLVDMGARQFLREIRFGEEMGRVMFAGAYG